MRKNLEHIAFGLLLGWTVVATGIVLYRTRRPATFETLNGARYVSNWRQVAKKGDQVAGTSSPTIVVFQDFFCPACRLFSATLDSLRRRHPEVTIIERHFPLPSLHPGAYAAALIAECASEQGKYEVVRTALFKRTLGRDTVSWHDVVSLGSRKDSIQFAACIQSPAAANRVDEDIRVGERLHLAATPSVLVNDSLFRGSLSLAALESMISRGGPR